MEQEKKKSRTMHAVEKMTISSMNGAGKTGCPHVQELNWTIFSRYT